MKRIDWEIAVFLLAAVAVGAVIGWKMGTAKGIAITTSVCQHEVRDELRARGYKL